MNNLSRRGLFGLVLAAFGWRPKASEYVSAPSDVSHRPWSSLVNIERDGLWADYAAWKLWLHNSMADFYAPDSPYAGCEELLDNLNCGEDTAMYCIMCRVADRDEEATHA